MELSIEFENDPPKVDDFPMEELKSFARNLIRAIKKEKEKNNGEQINNRA